MKESQYSIKDLCIFIIPSLIGIFLFMVPLPYDGEITIPVALLAKGLEKTLSKDSNILIPLVTVIVIASSVISLFCVLFKPNYVVNNSFLNKIFLPSPLWLMVRIIGAIIITMTYFNIGFFADYQESTGGFADHQKSTGGFILYELMPVLFSVFLFAGLLLPLLLNFGLLEFIGTFLSKIMQPLFNLPGRCAIDCMASWLGDGSVGILLTNKQYEDHLYTQKEAAIVATTFSAVSITFSLVVLDQVHLVHLFVPYYATICLSGFVAAIILPRIPPLSLKKDLYIDGSIPEKNRNLTPSDHTTCSWALHQAIEKSKTVRSPMQIIKEGLANAVDMIFSILPVVMGFGTLALVLAEYTHIFLWLGKPFVPFLMALGIPEAVEASKTIMTGFADQFIPATLAAKSIHSEMTRFIIAALSVTQLIYMSEVGALLLGSRIPINFIELVAIFILRTLITLPIIAGVAHLIF